MLLSACDEGTKATFNVSNEQLTPFSGTVELSVRTRELETLHEETYPVSVEALTAKDIVTKDFAAVVAGREHETFLVYTLRNSAGQVVSSSTMLFVRPKFFAFRKPGITAHVTGDSGNLLLHLCADTFVSKLRVEFVGSDAEPAEQYFDLNGKDEVVVPVCAPGMTPADLEKSIAFFSVADIAPACLGCAE